MKLNDESKALLFLSFIIGLIFISIWIRVWADVQECNERKEIREVVKQAIQEAQIQLKAHE